MIKSRILIWFSFYILFVVGKGHSTVTDLKDVVDRYFITFIYRYKSSDFIYKKVLSETHQNLHNTISKLKSEGLGYRKISMKLNQMGIKSFTGKEFYPSLVSVIWKKIEKKERLQNYQTISEYKDFDLGIYN